MIHCALLVTALVLNSVAAQSRSAAPPGLVPIPGGNTWIGTDKKRVLALGAQTAEDFMLTVNETPMKSMDVDDFFLGVTEVTNEQFVEYVKSAGARPPEAWGIDAINEAQVAHAAAERAKSKKAQEENKRYEMQKFDQAQWWSEHWKEVQWAVPKGQETLPAVYVSHAEASRYARWAGVRLMTEFEFQRAGRGKTKDEYTWGPTWDATKCANQTARKNLPNRVGSFAVGATAQGIHDLCGNVWEWTASPYLPFPDFEVLQLELGRGGDKQIIDGVVKWDEKQRVAVGGSYQNGELAARLTTRRGTDPAQSADGLGFRVAASVTPGIDLAAAVLAEDVPSPNPSLVARYDMTHITVADHWTAAPGTAKTELKGSIVPIAGYAVITGYDYVLYVPATDIDVAALGQLESKTQETGPVQLGLVSMTVPAVEPALPGGTYFVSFRGPGKLREGEWIRAAPTSTGEKNASQEPAQEPAAAEKPTGLSYPPGFDPDVANLLFHTMDMQVVAVQPSPSLSYTRPEPGTVVITEGRRSVPATDANGAPQLDEQGQPVMTEEGCSIATLKTNALVKVPNKGFVYDIVLKFPSGKLSRDWRK